MDLLRFLSRWTLKSQSNQITVTDKLIHIQIFRPKYYVPSNPYITPSFYPQTPLPLLNSPSLFSQLDLETLFYVFYYHCGTYQQYVSFPTVLQLS